MLTKEDKDILCQKLAELLPSLRKMMGLTQQKLGDKCGFSRIRVSHIENSIEKMSWLQFMSIMYVCSFNAHAVSFLRMNEIITEATEDYFSRNT